MNVYNYSNTDLRLTSNYKIEIGEKVDYKNKICVKPWGYEFYLINQKK